VERLKERLRGIPEADQKTEAAIRRVHVMRTGEEYVETGNDLRSRWRKWVRDMTVAICNLTEENLQSTIEMVSEDRNAKDVLVQLEALAKLETKGQVRGATSFSMEQLRVLCLHPHECCAQPPETTGPLTIHMFGDATTILRTSNAKYDFNQTLESAALSMGRNVTFVDHCQDGHQLLGISEEIMKGASKYEGKVYPDNHLAIVIWAGTDFSWDNCDTVSALVFDKDFLKDKIAVLASALGLLQRSLVVFCERPEYFGQGPAWGTVMARSRVYCNLLGLTTCDGGSLCRGLSRFRVKRPGGKQNNWSSNFDPECRKVLIKEVGKLCHLAELLPLRSEIARGAINRNGRTIEVGEHLVIVLPDQEVEQEPVAEEEKALAEDADADVTVEELDVPAGGDSVAAGPGGEALPAGEDSVLTSGSGRHKDPAYHGVEAPEAVPMAVEGDEANKDNMQQRSDANDFVDPNRGWPRPTGLCKGCWIYQFKQGLARAWTLPPHIRGGTIAVRLNGLRVGDQFGEVTEVYHSALFTTVKIKPTEAIRVLMQDQKFSPYEFIYINVWSSRNAAGNFAGVKFCGIEYPGDRELPQDDSDAFGGDPVTAGRGVQAGQARIARKVVAPHPGGAADNAEWTVIKNREEVQREKTKTLVFSSEAVCAQVKAQAFGDSDLVKMPDGSIRVPTTIPEVSTLVVVS